MSQTNKRFYCSFIANCKVSWTFRIIILLLSWFSLMYREQYIGYYDIIIYYDNYYYISVITIIYQLSPNNALE